MLAVPLFAADLMVLQEGYAAAAEDARQHAQSNRRAACEARCNHLLSLAAQFDPALLAVEQERGSRQGKPH